ncbi:MAG: hypothetical protein JSS66_10170 [Armatimonadetes bacterium]|nr:hypothetical protein [Armatimonadota bacterium]
MKGEPMMNRLTIMIVLYAWVPLAVTGITLAVLYLLTNWLNFQYLALWCLIPFVPSFLCWRKHVWAPWSRQQAAQGNVGPTEPA